MESKPIEKSLQQIRAIMVDAFENKIQRIASVTSRENADFERIRRNIFETSVSEGDKIRRLMELCDNYGRQFNKDIL